MVCGDRIGDAAYGKIMRFITQNVMLLNKIIFHILPISVNILQKWFAVVWIVCGCFGWFSVVCGNSTVPGKNLFLREPHLHVQHEETFSAPSQKNQTIKAE